MSQLRILNEVLPIGGTPSRVLQLRQVTVGRVTRSRGAGLRPVCYIIPGNPGLATFYSSFMQHLWRVSKGKMDIITVSHVGQDPGLLKCDVEQEIVGNSSQISNEHKTNPDEVNTNKYYTVADQVQHHITALRQLTEENQPVIIMCHSMGSYLTLKICRESDIERRVIRIFHLYPCTAWMGSSPNGQRLAPILTKYQSWMHTIHWMVTFIPHFIIRSAARLHLSDVAEDFKEECVEIVMGCVVGEGHREAVASMFALGGNEVHVIKEFDFHMLRHLKTRSTFICSQTDGWCPLQRLDELREEIPDSDILMTDDIPHAFCLHKSAEVAEIVWDKLETLVT